MKMAKRTAPMASKPAGKLTLCVDIGGTGVKAIVIEENQMPLTGRMREKTPRLATPEAICKLVAGFTRKAGRFDRVSVAFPGIVRNGVVHTAPNLE